MKKDIELSNIIDFEATYKKNDNNKLIEDKIRKVGIKKASITSNLSNIKYDFNINVPEVKIYDQRGSYQCDIYAFLRVVKDILRKRTKLDVDNLDLSSNYINFYDKLEKANSLYNELIKTKNLSYSNINRKTNWYIGSYGTFHYCREIVNKYGLVLSQNMKEVDEQYNDLLVIELLRLKIKTDATSLIKLSLSERKAKKQELIYGVFEFLSKIYGVPPTEIIFEDRKMTPLQIKEKYLKNYLADFVTLTSFKKDTFFSSYAYIPNLNLNRNERILYIPINKLKMAILKQLRDGISVWFSSEESTTLDYDLNILDDKLYDVYSLFNIKNISRKKKLLLDIINYDHAMCITGALLKKGKVVQYKVDNSFGEHGLFAGRLIMTPSFLEKAVITVIIDKKYL